MSVELGVSPFATFLAHFLRVVHTLRPIHELRCEGVQNFFASFDENKQPCIDLVFGGEFDCEVS